MHKRTKQAEQKELDLGEPEFVPLHYLFKGKAKVHSSPTLKDSKQFFVNLTTGTCECPVGSPFKWENGEWIYRPYCSHKIKALADITDRHKNDSEVMWAYTKAVASRYNVYEVVSAFHKELRRGAVERAIFWGGVLITFRGMKNVLKYMANIIYEETRDHELHSYLLGLWENPERITFANICKAITLFCNAPKKWEMPHRLKLFSDEQKAYKNLAKDYSYDVAKGRDIIPNSERSLLLRYLHDGFKRGDRALMQQGLKGLYKMKPKEGSNHDQIQHLLFRELKKVAAGKRPNAFKHSRSNVRCLIALIRRRLVAFKEIGYHQLNALADCLSGEKYHSLSLSKARRRAILLKKFGQPFPLGVAPTIPIYAHDNHTYLGKIMLRRYPHELKAGAKQVQLDLRWCGAYFGVAWRMLAYDQFGSCDVKWGDVRWPVWLHKHCEQMFY